MPDIEEQLHKKKPFKKKTYRSYLSLDETLEDVSQDSKGQVEESKNQIPVINGSSALEAALQSESVDKLEADQEEVQFCNPAHDFVETQSIKSTLGLQCVTNHSAVEESELKTNTPSQALKAFLSGSSAPPATTMPNIDFEPLNASAQNLQQTHNKLTSQPTTVVQHTYNKPTSIPTTILQQTYSIKDETYNKLTSQPTTVVQSQPTTVVQQNIQPNLQQTSNNSTTRQFGYGVNRLSGQRLRALNHFFDKCIGNGSRLTGPLSVESLSIAIECNIKTTQTVVYRLEKEGYILRVEFKAGRGGWTSYEIPQDIYNQMLQLTTKPTTNLRQNLQHTYNKLTAQLTSELTTTAPSKLDSKNNLNLTNLTQPPANPWFKDLDFSKVTPIGPMQVNSTIRNLVQEKLNPDDVQNFLNRFTSWVATQSKISNPLGMFCEKLKEFANEGDSPILYAMTEEERQIEAQFAAQVEKARAEMELINKAREQSRLKQKEESFESWFQNASEEEMINLFKPNAIAKLGSPSYKLGLKAVYMESEAEGN